MQQLRGQIDSEETAYKRGRADNTMNQPISKRVAMLDAVERFVNKEKQSKRDASVKHPHDVPQFDLPSKEPEIYDLDTPSVL